MTHDVQSGPLLTALRLSRTVVKKVISNADFWVFFAVHCTFNILYRLGYFHEKHWAMNNDDMHTITAATTFFEVFYTSQCYGRYCKMWSLTKGSFRLAYSYASSVRLWIRPCGKPYDVIACRWLVVSLILSIVESREKRSIDEEDLRRLQELSLLKEEEIGFIRSLAGHQRMLVMLHASSCVAQTGLKKANAPPNVPVYCNNILLKFRAKQQEMEELHRFPIPFEYVHLLSFMITINLIVWAYGMAHTESVFAPVFFFFAALIFMGMMDLASQLADPFGEDEADFPVAQWLSDFLRQLSAILEYSYEGTVDSYKKDVEAERQARTRLRCDLKHAEYLLGSGSLDSLGLGGGRKNAAAASHRRA